jgi:carboxyl-terminal processing protease
MSGRSLAWLLPGLLPALLAASPKADETYKVGPLAHRVWQATDVILERHLEPPARQQMLLVGLKFLLRTASAPVPADLGARVSGVTREEQFAALLGEVWPAKAGAKPEAVEELENAVLHGLLSGLREEDFTRGVGYMTPHEVHVHGVLSGNRYVGTGIQIRMDPKEELTQIVVPFPGGPARKAGARPNDLIVEVDGVSMKGVPLGAVVKKIQGEDGTPVTLTVRQPGSKETRVLKMIRGVIPFSSVLGYRRVSEEGWSFKPEADSSVGYLRVADLKASTLLELRKLEPLVKAEGVRALVLDMRFTQGSEMTHAALVADAFLDGGLLWRVRDAGGRVKDYRADRDCLFRDMPLVVLTGAHTGGLAEAVAAALQDNGRAVVVGEHTKARAYVTSVVPMPDGTGALQLRTGVLLRAGRPGKPEEAVPLSESGVRPDYPLTMDPEKLDPLMEWARQQESPEPPGPGVKPPQDRQLTKALAVLREKLALDNMRRKGRERHQDTEDPLPIDTGLIPPATGP